jgi:hypothetical protein
MKGPGPGPYSTQFSSLWPEEKTSSAENVHGSPGSLWRETSDMRSTLPSTDVTVTSPMSSRLTRLRGAGSDEAPTQRASVCTQRGSVAGQGPRPMPHQLVGKRHGHVHVRSWGNLAGSTGSATTPFMYARAYLDSSTALYYVQVGHGL